MKTVARRRVVSAKAASGALPQMVLTQVASDNFNRANGSLAGGNWSTSFGHSASISSNTLVGTVASAGNSGNFRSGESYNSDQYSRATISSLMGVGDSISLSVRNQDASNHYLGLYYRNGSSNVTLQIFKLVTGTYGALSDATYTVTSPGPATGVLTLVAEGGTISLFDSHGNGATAFDATFTGGTPGIVFSGNTGALDDWDGGNAATGALSVATVSDNFNRANNGLTVGQANWQVMTGYPASDPTIVSNQLAIGTAAHYAAVRTDSWGADQWASAEVGSGTWDSGGFLGLLTRVNSGLDSGYLGVAGEFGGTERQYAIFRLDSGTATPLFVMLSSLGLDASGTEYWLVSKNNRHSFRIGAGGISHELFAVTDSTYTTGKPGIQMFGVAYGDNWSAGSA